MGALYRSGRQAETLSVYERARHHLITTLGIKPGPSLRARLHAILTHTPAPGPGLGLGPGAEGNSRTTTTPSLTSANAWGGCGGATVRQRGDAACGPYRTQPTSPTRPRAPAGDFFRSSATGTGDRRTAPAAPGSGC
ncbi:BTAD domain-containing putative transcriptional regulator [Streptomyces sp. NPDC051098]|uniref:BTAD domain-containing putative transcriptional regulator n=1 Tax=Streptomyces sp. NPDC051098 TaxID=3155411 RepID=UPI003421D525